MRVGCGCEDCDMGGWNKIQKKNEKNRRKKKGQVYLIHPAVSLPSFWPLSFVLNVSMDRYLPKRRFWSLRDG